MTPISLCLLAAALVAAPPRSGRQRLLARRTPPVPLWRGRRPRKRAQPADPLALAAGWDLLSTGLRSGLGTPVIVRAVADEVGGEPSRVLREVADLLSLGADPVAAWESALRHPATADFARAARRTARSGSALADAAGDAATRERAAAGERAQVHAHRAGVWVALPLGLCFLPAFLCLGIVPIVVGMFQRLTLP